MKSEPNKQALPGPSRWIVLLLSAITIFLLAYLFLVSTKFGQEIENAAFLGAQDASPRIVTDVDRALNAITVSSLAIAVVVIGIIGLIRKIWRLTIVAMSVVGFAVVSAEVLKRFLLVRPDLVDATEPLLHNSFPSGHTTIAMSILIAVFLVVPYRFRGVAIGIVMSWAVLIGPFTMIDRWHRLSGTIGGMCLALIFGSIAALLLRHWGLIRIKTKIYKGRVAIYIIASIVGLSSLVAGLLISLPQLNENLNAEHVQDTIFSGFVLISLSCGIFTGLIYWASWHHLDVATKANALSAASEISMQKSSAKN